MVCLSSVSPPAVTAKWEQRRSSTTIVATRAMTAYVLGGVLRRVALYGGSEYEWEGFSDAETFALEAVVQAAVHRVVSLMGTVFGAGDDVYRPADSPACGQAHEILSRADVQRALDALTAGLLIHGMLTGDEVAEIVLTAFVDE